MWRLWLRSTLVGLLLITAGIRSSRGSRAADFAVRDKWVFVYDSAAVGEYPFAVDVNTQVLSRAGRAQRFVQKSHVARAERLTGPSRL